MGAGRVIGLDEVEAVLPHGYPMLLPDRVVEHVPSPEITAVKAITVDESWRHAAGVLCTWDERDPDVLAGRVMMFGSMAGVKFLRPVCPAGCAVEYDRIVMVTRPADEVPGAPRGRRSDDGVS